MQFTFDDHRLRVPRGVSPLGGTPVFHGWRRILAGLVSFGTSVGITLLVGGAVWLAQTLGGDAALLWAPAGIIFALMSLFGLRDWPWMALGLVPVALGAHPLGMVPAGLLIACQIGGCALATTMLRRGTDFDPSLPRIREVITFAGAVLTVGIVAGGMPALVTAALHLNSPAVLAPKMGIEIARTMIGVILFAPPILSLGKRPARTANRFETLLLLTALNLVGTAAVFADLPAGYLTMPIVIWSAIRLGQRETSFVVAIGAIWVALQCSGFGGGIAETSRETVIALSYMALLAMVGFAIGATKSRRSVLASI